MYGIKKKKSTSKPANTRKEEHDEIGNEEDSFSENESDYDSEEDHQGPEQEKKQKSTRPLDAFRVIPASALSSKGTRQFYDKVDSLNVDEEDVEGIYSGPLGKDQLRRIVEWDESRIERTKKLRDDPSYQFASLVAGQLGYSDVEPLLRSDRKWTTKDSESRDISNAKNAIQQPLANGFLNFSDFFVSAIRSSYVDLSNSCEQAQNLLGKRKRSLPTMMTSWGRVPGVNTSKTSIIPSIKEITEDTGELRIRFAELVSKNILRNNNISGRGYHLQRDYPCIMLERNQALDNLTGYIMFKK